MANILSKEIDWTEVIKEMKVRIKSEQVAQEALMTMTRLGCDENRILRGLYEYSGGSPADVNAVKAHFRSRKTRILNLSKRMAKMASEIEQVEKDLAEAQIIATANVAEGLRSHAEFLSRVAQSTLENLTSERVSGRDHHLVFLAWMFRQITGKPHYKELAELADTVGRLYDSNYVPIHTAGSMRKRVVRNGPLDLFFSSEVEALKGKASDSK
jgi:hypothetical protein